MKNHNFVMVNEILEFLLDDVLGAMWCRAQTLRLPQGRRMKWAGETGAMHEAAEVLR
jgi:hypothetical protein